MGGVALQLKKKGKKEIKYKQKSLTINQLMSLLFKYTGFCEDKIICYQTV